MRVRHVLATPNSVYRASYVPNLDFIGDVLPCQMEVDSTPPFMLGWRKLACAVIEDALRCAGLSDEKPVPNGGSHMGRRGRQMQQQDAVAYLMGEQPHVAFPLDVTCALVGINPEALRERVLRAIHRDRHLLSAYIGFRLARYGPKHAMDIEKGPPIEMSGPRSQSSS